MENEEDLHKLRLKYFPLLKKKIITGYNVYPPSSRSSSNRIFLNYLHSDLKEEDLHFKELLKKLKGMGVITEKIGINDRLVELKGTIEREADYITRSEWENPPNTRYFTYGAVEVERDKAKDLGDVIGESLQYDLLFEVESVKELRLLVDIFKEYASKYKLDKNGRKILKGKGFLPNEEAITNAWDIPLLTYNSIGIKSPHLNDFLLVHQFNIIETLGGKPVVVNTLVQRNTQKLERALIEMSTEIEHEKKYAIRVFVEDYLDA